jgi:spore coat protein U-like protein
MATVNLDTASRLDIVCRKGDTFTLVLDFGVSMDSTAANWKMQIAPSDTDDATISLEGSTNFTIEDNDDGVTNAKVTITIASDVMGGLSSGLYVYDLQTDSNTAGTTIGTVKTHLYGTFKVNEDITFGTV